MRLHRREIAVVVQQRATVLDAERAATRNKKAAALAAACKGSIKARVTADRPQGPNDPAKAQANFGSSSPLA